MRFRELPAVLRAYLVVLCGAGGVALTLALIDPNPAPVGLMVALLGCALLVSAWKIEFSPSQTQLTLTSAVVCLAQLLAGRPAAMLCAGLGSLVGSAMIRPGKGFLPRLRFAGPDSYYVPFNVANALLSTFCSGALHRWAAGSQPNLTSIAIGALLFQASQFLLNTSLTALALAPVQQDRAFKVWRESFLWTAPSYVVSASIAAGVWAAAQHPASEPLVLLVLPPLYFVYHFHRVYLDRMSLYASKLDQDRRHIAELSQLNSAIIASLATAIDAKDRDTRSHINRVQMYAVALAEAVGLSGGDLEAVRTGALIHDIGKLGIPERILGKPGKLTPDEFERMKAHVNIGVEILEPVEFPYPVKPIVLTHHERWDGLGYPQGLRGEDIPIGGRIMAIADVFDALTSTRPYRNALSLPEAIRALRDGAGKQFDPKLVDVFIRILPEVRRQVEEHEAGKDPILAEVDRPAEIGGVLALISQAAVETSATCELAQGLAAASTVREVVEVVVDRSLRLLPADTAVLYLCSEETGELAAEALRGLYAEKLAGLTISRGEGVSGWVAETLQPQVNAQASLDIARRFNPSEVMELSSAVAVPLAHSGATLGVLTLYTTGYSVLSEPHLGVLNVLAEHAVSALVSAKRYEQTRELSLTDPLTGLANSRSLFHHLELLCSRWKTQPAADQFAVLMMDLDGLKQVNDTRGHLAGDKLLREFADIVRRLSREEDLVCRYAGDEFVVVLSEAGSEAAQAFVGRVREAFSRSASELGPFGVTVSVGSACYPADGHEGPALLAAADERMYGDKFRRRTLRRSVAELEER